MGGIGSGRHWHCGTKNTVESYRRLDVRRWAREGFLVAGSAFGWQWTQDGEQVADIRVRVETGRIWLIYKTRDSGGDWEPMDYPVRMLSTPCHYGGSRVWFECPARGCGRPTAFLYGGKVFACRHCHQLAYPSQRERPFERASRRADRIRARLGWETEIDEFAAQKPKGMHWRTLERLRSELGYWEGVSGEGLEKLFMKLTGKFGA